MSWLIRFLRCARAPFRRDELRLDINEEFRAHIELETEERIRAGMNPQEARRTALRDFGGIDRYFEEARSVRGASWDLLNELRHSLRVLRREKAFTATVLITLAVCVGVNAAIFSVVNAVLLAPLPFSKSERLVAIWNSYPGAGVPRAPNAPADYFVRRERVELFESLAQFWDWNETVGDAVGSERVAGMRVTPSFFPMLGVRPRLGRVFHEEE
ncbi:MAG: permease prefix domain 1-containing protein, partial [Longimicrobiales bacterium]